MKGSVSSSDLPAVCQSEAAIPQPLAHLPQQLPVKPQGQSPGRRHSHVFAFELSFGIFQNKTKKKEAVWAVICALRIHFDKKILLRRRRTSLSMLLHLAALFSPRFALPKGEEGRQIAEWFIGAHKGSCKCLIHNCAVKRKMLEVFTKVRMIVSQLPFKCRLNHRQCFLLTAPEQTVCLCVCERRTRIPKWHALLWNHSTACCGSTWSGLSVRATLEHRGNRRFESVEHFLVFLFVIDKQEAGKTNSAEI